MRATPLLGIFLVLAGCQPTESALGTVSAVPTTDGTSVAIGGAKGASGAPATAAAGPAIPAVPCDTAFTGGPAAGPKPAVTTKKGEGYVVEYVAAATADVGKPAATCVRITPTAPYHVNLKYPFQVDVTPPAGVDARTPMHKEDAEAYADTEARVSLAFIARDGGDKNFAATIHFGICSDAVCETPTEELAWKTAAK